MDYGDRSLCRIIPKEVTAGEKFMDDIKLTTGSMLEKLILDIEKTVINAKENISYSVNHTITETYWTIGKYIVESEQDDKNRAAYGSKMLTMLSYELTLRLGKVYSRPNLNNMRKFYLCYPICQTVSDKWSLYFFCVWQLAGIKKVF